MRKAQFILFGLLIILFQIVIVSAQNVERLNVGEEKNFALAAEEGKSYALDLKKDEYTEIFVKEKGDKNLYVSLVSPTGRMLLKDAYLDVSYPLIASETGIYKLTVKFLDNLGDGVKADASVSYINSFKLPASAKLKRQRKINGYDAKVYNVADDDNIASYLLIEKSGKLKGILKSGSLVGGGFQFPDDPKLWDYVEGKKSAALFRTTLDKTGDGTPDIAVQEFSGGAHCCTTMYFFELGVDEVRELPPVEGADSDVIAIGKNSQGSLLLKTGDSSFAYWLTSFAGSPIPTIILSFQDGEFRPDLKAMKKPAPTLAAIKRKAAKAKKDMDLTPYLGVEESNYLNAFWGEMLDMIYSGNENSAWQYFDLVWDKRKPGKEKFKEDFLNHLNTSDYWKMMSAQMK